MARPKQDGLLYFPLDIDFFTDRKIKVLKSNYGADGIAIYLYLLCEIYKAGFYIWVDDDFIDIVADDLNMSGDKIRQVMNFLLLRSLFNNTLYWSDKVLTSAGIQKRFQEAVKTKALKNPVEVNEFWLLSEKDTQSFIKLPKKDSYSKNNPSYSKNNPSYSENNSVNESKVNESKVNIPPLSPKGKTKAEQSFLECKDKLEKSDLSTEEKNKVGKWLQYKKERRDVYEPTGFDAFLSRFKRMVNQFGKDNVFDVIEYTMSNNFKGVTWDRLSKNTSGGKTNDDDWNINVTRL